jgi:CubicO group peptidase (beta-lactamase class C family)
MRTKSAILFAVLLSAAIPSCKTVQQEADARPAGIVWSQAKMASTGLDAAAIAALYDKIAQDPHHDLKGIVILRDGMLATEHYFNGDSVSTLHDIRSATKSITSLLLGLAVQQGLIHSVNDSIALYLPDMPRDGKEKITIKDLLNMRSGLDANDDPSTLGAEENLDNSTDWMRAVFAVPLIEAPGTRYNYCSINAFLVGAIVENASHKPLDQFANKNLFGSLGIGIERWRHVPVDRVTGQGNLSITTRDLAAIGELMRNGGVVAGKQILNASWVKTSLATQVSISTSDPYADFYGYMWYTRVEQVGTRQIIVHFASGNGGNKVYVVPSLHLVVAITSSAYNTNYGQRRSHDILLNILAATQSST